LYYRDLDLDLQHHPHHLPEYSNHLKIKKSNSSDEFKKTLARASKAEEQSPSEGGAAHYKTFDYQAIDDFKRKMLKKVQSYKMITT
jgi:ribosomal protein L14E/L6E/L27E